MQDRTECSNCAQPLSHGSKDGLCIECRVDAKIGVFVHASDNDGHFSGYLARRKYPLATIKSINYGYNDVNHLLSFDRIIFIDITVGPDVMVVLLTAGKMVEVYDHHASVFDMYQGFIGMGLHYYYDDSKCGAKLFADLNGIPDRWCLEVVDRYDRFDFNHKDIYATEYLFTLGTSLHDMMPESETNELDAIWHDINGVLAEGRIVLNYQLEQLKHKVANAREVMIGDMLFLAINSERTSPQFVKHVGYSGAAEGIITYNQNKDGWHYSLRSFSDKPVVQVAKIFGGGGHSLAAGFSTEKLIGELA